MKCINVKPLIPAFTDNELEDRDFEEVTSHLSDCSRCSNELKEWQNIKMIMRDIGNQEIAAPLGLQAAVLGQLKRENTWQEEMPSETLRPKTVPAASIFTFINKFSTRIKRGVAAAAAVIIMGTAAGGLWMQNAVNLAESENKTKPPLTQQHVPVEHQPKAIVLETETKLPDEKTSSDEKDSPAPALKNDSAQPVNSTQVNEPVNAPLGATVPDDSTGGQSPDTESKVTEAQPQQVTTEQSSDVVLLKVEKIIHSGQIKITDTNLTNLHDTAIAKAEKHGAIFAVQVLGQTENGTGREMVKFTVPKDNFNSLYNDLLALGQVVDKGLADDNISERYRQTDAQLMELRAQKQQPNQTTAQQKETEEKIASLEEQLNRWDQSVKTGTIALWLEGTPG